MLQRISEKPVREILKLREQHARVERRPVDRPASQGDLDQFKEGALEVRETTEEPVVTKSARVVEEVAVSKEVKERSETITDKVRRKDVDVEHMAGTADSASRQSMEHAAAADLPRPGAGDMNELGDTGTPGATSGATRAKEGGTQREHRPTLKREPKTDPPSRKR